MSSRKLTVDGETREGFSLKHVKHQGQVFTFTFSEPDVYPVEPLRGAGVTAHPLAGTLYWAIDGAGDTYLSAQHLGLLRLVTLDEFRKLVTNKKALGLLQG